MSRKITTISLSEEDLEIIDKYNLSPTALIKSKLTEIREFEMQGIGELKEANRKLEAWKENAQKFQSFIEKKGLLDAYLAENGV